MFDFDETDHFAKLAIDQVFILLLLAVQNMHIVFSVNCGVEFLLEQFQLLVDSEAFFDIICHFIQNPFRIDHFVSFMLPKQSAVAADDIIVFQADQVGRFTMQKTLLIVILFLVFIRLLLHQLGLLLHFFPTGLLNAEDLILTKLVLIHAYIHIADRTLVLSDEALLAERVGTVDQLVRRI